MKTTYEDQSNGKAIIVTRVFDAPLNKVWNAWTNSEILDTWWAPKPWKAKTKSFDFRPGGDWLYAMQGPEGEEHWAIVKYESVDPNKSFTGTDNFCDEEGNINSEFGNSHWDVAFSDNGNDTTKVVVTLTFASEEDKSKLVEMGFKEGFSMGHDNLDEVLKNG